MKNSGILGKILGIGLCTAAAGFGAIGFFGMNANAAGDETVYYAYENEGDHAYTWEEEVDGKKQKFQINENGILNNGNADRKRATAIKVNTEVYGYVSHHFDMNGVNIMEIQSQSDVDYYYFEIGEPGTISLSVSHDGVYQGNYQPECGPWIASVYGGDTGMTLYTTVVVPGGEEQSKDAIDGHLKTETSFNYNITPGKYYVEFKSGDYVSLADPAYYFKVNYEPSKGKAMEQESNETAVTATTIPLNKEYWGQLALTGDIDWYSFTLPKSGTVSLSVRHTGVAYEKTQGANFYPWYASLYGDVESSIKYLENVKVPAGDASTTRTFDVNLTEGTYYVKMNRANYHVGNTYYLTVNYESNDEYTKRVGKKVELEDNNTVSYSNPITITKDTCDKFNGQLSTSKDEDWYSFTLSQPAYVKIGFDHDVWDETTNIWAITLFKDKFVKDTYLTKYIAANRPDEYTDEIALADGTYYFQVKGSRWVPDTYTVWVNADWIDLDCDWFDFEGRSYWYEGNVRQGTLGDPQGVIGDGTVRGREICDNKILDDFGNGTWFWLDAGEGYNGAKAVGKEVWMPYIYQDEATFDDARIDQIAAESDYGMEGMGRCVRDAIKNKAGKWVRYDQDGKMLKGWVEINSKNGLDKIYPKQVGNKYYYDSRTGLMAKGEVKIDGVVYHFDEVSGVLIQ